MTAPARSRVEDSLATNESWLFLSPHLDDAILSCGALIQAAAGTRDVAVATLFTEAGPGPLTRSARAFLQQCSAERADTLFEARKREDAAVLGQLGVRLHHFGAMDALFRRREGLLPGIAALGRTVPELVHRYPSYRFSASRGRVSRGDRALIAELVGKVATLIEAGGFGLVFCPLGVGGHVDHVITRMVGAKFPELAVFYSDFPYDQRFGPDENFLNAHGLRPWLWEEQLAGKQPLVRQYASQMGALFDGGHIPVSPEIYYVPS